MFIRGVTDFNKKNLLWVVEYSNNKTDWIFSDAHFTRQEARTHAKNSNKYCIEHTFSGRYRVRKYVLAEKQ